ncbi:MAG: peptidoglycan DD-metalloendopeptidase family protein [Lysinibacillus sp.]
MKSTKQKPFQIAIAVAALFLLIQTPLAHATNLSDLKEEKSKIEGKKNQLNSSINEKSGEIKSIEGKQDSLLNQIQTLNTKITSTNGNIKTVSDEITVANNDIVKLKASIDELLRKIEERDLLLEDRARALQASGSVTYLDVLLGSNSFVDFIDRMSAVSTLLEADRQIIRDQKSDKQSLEDQKAVLENKRQKLEESKSELERLKTSLDGQKVEKNNLVSALEKEQEKLKSEKVLLEKEYSEALDISAELQQKIISEQNRIAEIARQEEAKRKAQANANGGGGSTTGGTSGGSAPEVAAGTWTKPTSGRLTSPYGWRNFGGGSEFHYGIDLANSIGTPVVAAADGVVSYASPLSSFGNTVIITHSIEGKIFTTVYAHLNSFNVSVGSVVTKGQQVAAMGNTGRSTGPHLHFEIHNGPWRGQKVGSLNPLLYISL